MFLHYILTIFDLLVVIVPVLMSISLLFCCRKKKKGQFPAAFMQGYTGSNEGEPKDGQVRGKDSRGGMGAGAGGIGGDGFGGGQQFRAPEGGDAKKMAGTFDPNYQTLANINDDVFKKKEGGFGGGGVGGAGGGFGGGGGGGAGGGFGAGGGAVNIRAPEQDAKKMAGTFDPNYQTLAGLNEDVFKKKDGGGGGEGARLGGGGGGFGGGGGGQQNFATY